MSSSWQTETGHLVCRWSEVGKPLQYNPKWMQEASTSQGSYSSLFQVLRGIAHLVESLGSSPDRLTAIAIEGSIRAPK